MAIDKFSGVGFPSPARDFQNIKFNIHSFLVKRESSTFFMNMKGDAMVNFGIFNKDLLVIDRSIGPALGHFIVIVKEGEFLLKKFSKDLLKDDFEVWGVVIGVVRKML